MRIHPLNRLQSPLRSLRDSRLFHLSDLQDSLVPYLQDYLLLNLPCNLLLSQIGNLQLNPQHNHRVGPHFSLVNSLLLSRQ